MFSPSLLADPRIVPDPYPTYAWLVENEPVHWSSSLQAWCVMHYADCNTVLRHEDMKAQRMDAVLRLKFPGKSLPADSIYHQFTQNVMMYTDAPLHDVLRKSTFSGFTREAHEFYRQQIDQVTADLVAAIPEGVTEIDAVEALTSRLPVRAAVHAFGVPEEDLPFVLPRVAEIMTYWSGPQSQPIELPRLLACLAELHDYALELVQGQRGKVAPGTAIARLGAVDLEQAGVTLDQVIHQLVLLLIALFAPTTPGSASSGLLAFIANPEQIDRFRADPASAKNAADEVFRYNSSNQFTWRVAARDLENRRNPNRPRGCSRAVPGLRQPRPQSVSGPQLLRSRAPQQCPASVVRQRRALVPGKADRLDRDTQLLRCAVPAVRPRAAGGGSGVERQSRVSQPRRVAGEVQLISARWAAGSIMAVARLQLGPVTDEAVTELATACGGPSAPRTVGPADPELAALLDLERARQRDTLNLVAAAGFMHRTALACAGSELGNVSGEGYPGAQFHAGCAVADQVEELAVRRAKAAFRAQYANVQPHSGTSANIAVLAALLGRGGTLLAMDLRAGGHLSHGASASITGKHYRAHGYGVDRDGLIDLDEVAEKARRHRPRLIICGASAYPRRINFAGFRAVANSVGAYLLADVSHIAGLIVAGQHPNPIDHAHVTTCSTYKQLGGPRGGLILMGREAHAPAPSGEPLSGAIQRAVFPQCQGTPNFAAIAAKAAALRHARSPAFAALAEATVANARVLAQALARRGQRIVTGGSDTHMVIIDLRPTGLTGVAAERALEACGILANRNVIAGDRLPPAVAGGLRLGTNVVSLRGFGAIQIAQLATLIDRTLRELAAEGELGPAARAEIAKEVDRLCTQFPLPDT